MDYVVAGLPLHVLLVHVVVVATPALGLSLILAALWPAARRVLWLPNLIAAALLLPLGLVTIDAGRWLEVRVPTAPLIQEHTAQGDGIVPWLVGLLVVAVVIAVWCVAEVNTKRKVAAADTPSAPSRGVTVTAAVVVGLLAIGVTAGSTWTLVQIGESGSRAVWEGSFGDEPIEN